MIENIFRARASIEDIVDILGSDFFDDELNSVNHSCYIRSQNYYEWYYSIGKALMPRCIFEIGVRRGYSLASMIIGAIGPQLTHAIGWDNDSYVKDGLIQAESKIRSLLRHRVPVFQMNISLKLTDSQNEVTIPQGCDLVHIDGAHGLKEKTHDLSLCIGRANTIIVDDYLFIPDVRRACDEILNTLSPANYCWFILPSYRGTLVIQKLNA